MSKPNSIQNGLKAILKPIIRFCLRHSIKLQDLTEISKELFVTLSEESLETENKEPSISRISMVSGVHRKDVTRLKGINSSYNKKQTLDLSSRVIGKWQSDKNFCTAGGRPKTLSYQGVENEFKDLVSSVSKEVKSHTVLFDLERAGSVTKTNKGLKLTNKAYIPIGNVKKGLYFLETDLNDLVSSVEENLFSTPDIPNLHLKTEYTEIPLSKVPKIKKWLLDEGSNFHQKVRNKLSKLETKNSSKEYARVSVGTFSFSEELTNKAEQNENH